MVSNAQRSVILHLPISPPKVSQFCCDTCCTLQALRLETCNIEQFIVACPSATVKNGAEDWPYRNISWRKLEGVIPLDEAAERCNTNCRDDVTQRNNWK